MRWLNENLATFAKHRTGNRRYVEAKWVKDSWALSLQKYPKSAVSPSIVQFFSEGTWSWTWAVPPVAAGTEAPATLGCPWWRAWEPETVKCSCAREADLFCLSHRLLVLKLSPPRCSPRSVCPLLSASLWFSWDPGNILVSALRRFSAQGNWILVVGCSWPPSTSQLCQWDPRNSTGLCFTGVWQTIRKTQ